MPLALVTVTFAHASGLPEDSVVGSFPYQTASGSLLAQAGGLADISRNFYETLGPSSLGLSAYLSEGLSRAAGGVVARVYDLTDHSDGSPHGSPIYSEAYTLGIALPGKAPMPEEVALVLTTRALGWGAQPIERPDGADADSKIDRPRQRYSGRLYVGPFNTGALGAGDASGKSRPDSDLITDMLDAADQLQAAANALGHNWSVWSRKDTSLRNVDQVQVDDAWDTQRRRGVRPSARTTVTVG